MFRFYLNEGLYQPAYGWTDDAKEVVRMARAAKAAGRRAMIWTHRDEDSLVHSGTVLDGGTIQSASDEIFKAAWMLDHPEGD